ncbi:FxLYD domain-containing protein, partial [Staphylococcus nepalensis]|uniref:FxLYD domain-containing protein n=1 Tax=Staphylococcus nepalensis TaxID=214473 RepID=UPI0024B9F19B
IRLFEYDAQIALDEGEVTKETLTVTFPHTAVLYLRAYKKTPDKMKYVVITPGRTVQYDVPVMKVQTYTLDDIFEKGGSELVGGSGSSLYSDSSSLNESAYTALKITVDPCYSNGSYTICTGKVTNSGERTYKFVQVKGAFENSSGTVLDTDETYVCGSEGLEPGESSSFRLSVPKDNDIYSCSVSLSDYN